MCQMFSFSSPNQSGRQINQQHHIYDYYYYWVASLRPSSANIKEGSNCAACSVAYALPCTHHTNTQVSSAGCSQSSNSPEMHAPVSTPSSPPTIPANLPDLLHLYSPSRPLHPTTDTCLPQLPPCRYKMKGGRAFPHSGPSVWNSLPAHVEDATTTDTFKSALRP